MKYAKFVRELKKYGSVDKSWIAFREDQKIRNHTITLALRELKPNLRACEFACGQQVANQVVEYRRLPRLNGIWLRKCAACGLYEHPETKEMVDHRVINKWFPPRNKYYIEDEE